MKCWSTFGSWLKVSYKAAVIFQVKAGTHCASSDTWAARLIECDCHVHFDSKAGSVISSKSPSPVSDGASFITQS